MPEVDVNGGAAGPANAAIAPYQPPPANMGPLGKTLILDIPTRPSQIPLRPLIVVRVIRPWSRAIVVTARFQVANVTDTHYYVSIADGASIVGANGGDTAYLGAPRIFAALLS